MRHVLFLGAPGVGKGTYARRAAPSLGYSHISPGDLLRRMAKTDGELESILLQGKLVSENVVFRIMKTGIDQLDTAGVILDGFPRSVDQARGWMKISKIPDMVVEFQLPEDLLVQKLLGRRICEDCGDLYNVFAFEQGEYRMPAMMPQKESCCDKCGGKLVKRADDTIEIIKDRLKFHWKAEKDLIQFLESNVEVNKFHVKTGIAQLNQLVSLFKIN